MSKRLSQKIGFVRQLLRVKNTKMTIFSGNHNRCNPLGASRIPAYPDKFAGIGSWFSHFSIGAVERIEWMINGLCSQIFGVSFIRGFKVTKMDRAVFNLNLCVPLYAFFRYPEKSARPIVASWPTGVLLVFGASCFAQIIYSIVRSVAVDVVNLLFRPHTVNIEPRQPMCRANLSAAVNLPVSVNISASSNIADSYAIAGSQQSRKNTSLRIVMKKLAQTFSSEWDRILSSHDTSVKGLIGQRPGRIDSAFPASSL